MGLRSTQATTFREEGRIEDKGLVLLCEFSLRLRAGDGRNGGQANRVVRPDFASPMGIESWFVCHTASRGCL
jgi:hypothetical protein